MCPCPITLQHLHGEGFKQSCRPESCGGSFGNTMVANLVFANDPVLEVLVMSLKALHQEVKPLGLQVSWAKSDETVQSVYVCGEDIEILEIFSYLGSSVQNNGRSHQEVLQWIGLVHSIMDSECI